MSNSLIALLLPAIMLLQSPVTSSGIMPIRITSQSILIDSRVDRVVGLSIRELHQQTITESSRLMKNGNLDNFSLSYVYCLRGSARAHFKQYKSAVADLAKAIELNPKIEGQNRLYRISSDCCAAMGNYKDAVEAVTKSLEIEPSGLSLFKRAIYFVKLKKYEAGLKDLEQSKQFKDCPERDVAKLKLICLSKIPCKE